MPQMKFLVFWRRMPKWREGIRGVSPSPESSPIEGEEIASAREIGPRNDNRGRGRGIGEERKVVEKV
jgi:hypothetical protein